MKFAKIKSRRFCNSATDQALAPLIGLGDYEGYLRHFRSAHPDEVPLSRAKFFRAMQDSKAKNVKC